MRHLRRHARKLTIELLESRALMAADLTTNLVGHWPMNAASGVTATDIAGGDDNGTLSGGTTWLASGKIHGGLTLNGTTGLVSVPHSTGMAVGSNNVTIAAWIKTSAASGTIISKGVLTGDHIALQVIGGKARFQFNPGGGPFGVTGTKTINDGQWHLLIGVRTSTHSCALYVDGVLDGILNSTGSFTSVDLTAPLQIGTAGAGTYFNGSIDDVRFYGRGFNAEDAAALYVLGGHPVSINDEYVVLSQSTFVPANKGVLQNDGRRDETPLSANLLSPTSHGSITLNSDGSFTYVPQVGYVGLDSFTYRASDDVVDTASATVTLQVFSLAEWSLIGSRVATRALQFTGTVSAATVTTNLNRMNVDGSFSDLTYTTNTSAGASALNTHASRLSILSQAYKTVGNANYLNATLKQRIIDSYNYLAYTAPSSLLLPNWFDLKIGVPNNLWPGLVTMRNDLTGTLITDLLTKYVDNPKVWDLTDLTEKNGGANITSRARATIAVAVLKDDPSILPIIVSHITRDLNSGGYQATGLQPDDSFSQHTSFPNGAPYQGGVNPGDAIQFHSGSYGLVYGTDLSDIVPWVRGTTFAFSPASESLTIDFVLDGQAWLFRNKAIEATSTGRQISRQGQTLASNGMSSSATRLLALGIRTTELQAFINRLATGSTATNYLSGNKSFYTTDVMVQQRQGYMASLRMISQRTQRPETLTLPGNSIAEGAKNFFGSDGVTMIYQDGTEYGSVSGQEIFPVWNWTRLPGTTLEQIPDSQVISLSTSNAGSASPANTGTGIFVGSVSNGTVGAAAMDYGRSLGSVSAKKGYFYFDEGFIALGAGINAPSATNPVYTSLNQTFQNGLVTLKDSAGTIQSFDTGTTQTITNPQWLLHGGVGYVMLGNNGSVTVQAQPQSGDWSTIGTATGSLTKNVFSAWVDHGTAPQNGSYAYAVLPGMTASTLNSYLASSPLTVLSNTSSIQAVRNQVSGVTQIAFYQAGSLTIAPGLTVTVDKPSMVQVREPGSSNIELSVSDPTQSSSQIKVSLTRHLSGTNVVWQSTTGLSEITLTLPRGNNNINAGQTVVNDLTFVPPPVTIVGRHVYYRGSAFDTGGNSQAAIDLTKFAHISGLTTAASYTNFTKGINGIIIDVQGLPVGTQLSASDFEFQTKSIANGSLWQPLPASALLDTNSIVVLPGQGNTGSDRIKIGFDDFAITNKWLEVRMKATVATGLANADTFYFGNAAGEVYRSPGIVKINQFDVLAVRQAISNRSVSVSRLEDIDKDGKITSLDLRSVTQRVSNATVLTMINIPVTFMRTSSFAAVPRPFMNFSSSSKITARRIDEAFLNYE